VTRRRGVKLTAASDVLAKLRTDKEFDRAWKESSFARQVAICVLQYRAKHELTQSDLAKKLRMQQPAIARLEVGEHSPSLLTLHRLANRLSLHFEVDVSRDGVKLRRPA
jgi:DNA-binding XRE family transcriptional regulator